MNTNDISKKSKKNDKIFQAVSAALVAAGLGATGTVIANKVEQPVEEPEDEAVKEQSPINDETTPPPVEVREVHHHHYYNTGGGGGTPNPKPNTPDEQYNIKPAGEAQLVTLKNGEEAYVISATCNGKEALLVDFDKDGICDAIVWDKDGNGEIDPDEIEDLHEKHIEIPMPIPPPTEHIIEKIGEPYIIEEDGVKYVVQEGKVDGHPCSFVDTDGDNHVDVIIVYDENGEPAGSITPADLDTDIIIPTPVPEPDPGPDHHMEIVEVMDYEQVEIDGQSVDCAQVIVSVDGKQHVGLIYDLNHDGKADMLAIDINDDGHFDKDSDYLENLQEQGQDLPMNVLAEAVGHHTDSGPEPEIDIAITNVYQYDPENNRVTAEISVNGETHRAIILDTDNDGIADAAAIDLNDDGKFEDDSDAIIDLRSYGLNYSMNTLAHEAGYNESIDGPEGPANDDDIIANNTGQPTKDYTGQGDNNPDYKNSSDVAMLERKGDNYTDEVNKPNDKIVSPANTKEEPSEEKEDEPEVVPTEPHEPEVAKTEPHDEDVVETVPHEEDVEIAETTPHESIDDVYNNSTDDHLADNDLDPMDTDPMNMDDPTFDPSLA